MLVALLLILQARVVSPKRVDGVLASQQSFLYLDRFCFLSEYGNLNFVIEYPIEMNVQSLLLYYDTPDQWPAVNNDYMSCDEKVRTMDPTGTNNQQIRLSPEAQTNDQTTRCQGYTHSQGSDWVRCEGNRRFISARQRWWFLAISNCENGTQSVFVTYQLVMTNGESASDFFFYHFSADEAYIFPINLAFFALESLLFLITIYVAVKLSQRKMLHQSFKLFIEGVIFEIISLASMNLYSYKYARSGEGTDALKLLAQVTRAGSISTFILVLMLIAKGYTITRGRLSTSSMCKLTVLMTFFIASYFAMFVWELRVFDPSLVTYMSESLPGYLLASWRVAIWTAYVFSSTRTVLKYPSKRGFYTILGMLMTIWFWMGPVSLVMANFLLDNWVREEVVCAVDDAVVFYGHFVFLTLTWPSTANVNFPFHVRTTQVDSGPADFPHNNYEVAYSQNVEQAVIRHAATAAHGSPFSVSPRSRFSPGT